MAEAPYNQERMSPTSSGLGVLGPDVDLEKSGSGCMGFGSGVLSETFCPKRYLLLLILQFGWAELGWARAGWCFWGWAGLGWAGLAFKASGLGLWLPEWSSASSQNTSCTARCFGPRRSGLTLPGV